MLFVATIEDFRETGSQIVRLYILIPLFFILFWVGVAVLLVLIGYLRAREKQARVEHERQQEKKAALRPDGLPYPPSGRGLCDQCHKVFEKIYFAPNGRSLCPSCYHHVEKLDELPGKETP